MSAGHSQHSVASSVWRRQEAELAAAEERERAAAVTAAAGAAAAPSRLPFTGGGEEQRLAAGAKQPAQSEQHGNECVAHCRTRGGSGERMSCEQTAAAGVTLPGHRFGRATRG